MGKADTRYLERQGNLWRVTVPVPRKLQAKVGKTKLKRCLKTDSLRVANSLKWPIVSELKKQIRLMAQGTVHDPLLEEALLIREEFMRRDGADHNGFCPISEAITERAYALAGDPVDEDPNTGQPIFDQEREAQAGFYCKIATGQETPLTAFLDQWHRQEVARSPERGSTPLLAFASRTVTMASSGSSHRKRRGGSDTFQSTLRWDR
jgi:hypothetical protein